MNRLHNLLLRNVMYQFKRQYGQMPVDLYKYHGSDVDLKTGKERLSKDLHRFKRGIVIPARLSRNVVQTVSKVAAARDFIYGGTYDRRTRVFILERRDVEKGLEIGLDDWLVYRGRKYEIKHFDEFEFDTIWVIIGHAIQGEVPEQIFQERIDQRWTTLTGDFNVS